jgi:hypothetical protein
MTDIPRNKVEFPPAVVTPQLYRDDAQLLATAAMVIAYACTSPRVTGRIQFGVFGGLAILLDNRSTGTAQQIALHSAMFPENVFPTAQHCVKHVLKMLQVPLISQEQFDELRCKTSVTLNRADYSPEMWDQMLQHARRIPSPENP